MNVSRVNQDDEDIGTVGVMTAGELHEDRLNAWVAELLFTKGDEILSTRGYWPCMDQSAG